MKLTPLRANSDTSWLEATQQLITAAIESSKNLRILSIQEDVTVPEGKFRLMAHVCNP